MNLRKSVEIILTELHTQYLTRQEDERAPYLGVYSYSLSMDRKMSRDEAERALSYLASKELVELKESPFGGEKISYYITEKGRSYFLNNDYKYDLGWVNRTLLKSNALAVKDIIIAGIAITALSIQLWECTVKYTSSTSAGGANKKSRQNITPNNTKLEAINLNIPIAIQDTNCIQSNVLSPKK